MSLTFGDLFARALLEWPVEIDLGRLVRSAPASTSYTVRGLAEISDAIEARHIGTADEIIMRNLHYAIYRAVRDAAAYIVRIKMSDLRSDPIRYKFEEAIKDCMTNLDCGFLSIDIELGKRYFSENGEDGAS
ncbi:hypothetical protein [Paraburkholderia agricolaris]|jgi:hypothetical protein|uniref:hypothetical protein n=1 Tax=Paraburkholderia agricolaris TaxID=2152888 RepID=UPI0012920F89|nr:hypothetical protein [Paraburkholderia agricolaris]